MTGGGSRPFWVKGKAVAVGQDSDSIQWFRRGSGVGMPGRRDRRNTGSPGDNAPHDTDCVGGADRPMVCAEALLKLAHWCRQRRQLASGGELCSTSRKSESPPALASRG